MLFDEQVVAATIDPTRADAARVLAHATVTERRRSRRRLLALGRRLRLNRRRQPGLTMIGRPVPAPPT